MGQLVRGQLIYGWLRQPEMTEHCRVPDITDTDH